MGDVARVTEFSARSPNSFEDAERPSLPVEVLRNRRAAHRGARRLHRDEDLTELPMRL
jgi:hypothetical protein